MDLSSTAAVVTIVSPLLTGIIAFFVYSYKIAKMSKEDIKGEMNLLRGEIERLRSETKELRDETSRKFTECSEKTGCNRGSVEALNNMLNYVNHSFFDRMVFLLRFNSWKKECDDPVKGAIMYDMMMIKLAYWLRGYIKVFKRKDRFSTELLQEGIVELVNEYKDEWIKAGIPSNVTQLFNITHDARAQDIFQYASIMLENVESDIYNKIKFLDYSQIILDETLHDIHHVMKRVSIDGEYISNQKYATPFRGQKKTDIFAYGYMQEEIFID